MRNNTVYAESIEQKKKDSEELVEMLKKIPKERKTELLWMVKGFALCAEMEQRDSA